VVLRLVPGTSLSGAAHSADTNQPILFYRNVMMTKKEFENRMVEVKTEVRCCALEMGSIFILEALKEGILEDIEQAKLDAKEDVADGYNKEEDTTTVEFLQAYAVELDGILTRLNAIEEKYNPGGRELAAKTDALYEKYEAMLS
jgi:hypothetical protein